MKNLEERGVPDVKKSKNVFVSFAGPLLKFSLHLATSAQTLSSPIGYINYSKECLLMPPAPEESQVSRPPEVAPEVPPEYRERKRMEQRHNRALVTHILSEEFNQSYHPYYFVKQTFSSSLQTKYKEWLETKRTLDQLEREMRSDLVLFCTFLTDCSDIYRNWVVAFTRMRAEKVDNFMRKAAMNSVFYGPDNLHRLIMVAIGKVDRDRALGVAARIKDNVSVEKFSISPKLQIDGCFIQSLLLLSAIDRITNPKELLKFMERLKDQICNDIDYFHRFYETGENCTVDGDNLIGILCFLVCRMKAKLPEIYAQIAFLRVAFGDDLTLSYESASYMVTAFMATLEYIETEDFCKATST